MASEIFCPECGSKIKAGLAFCPNCGHKLSQINASTKKDDSTTTESSLQRSGNATAVQQPKKPLDKRLIGAFFVIIVIIVGGYFGLKDYYQPQKQFNRIITAMGNPDKSLVKYIKTNDPTLQNKISDKNLKPIQKYFEKNKQALAELKTTLQQGSTYNNTYSIEQSGKAWLFFPRYKVNVAAAYVTLSTNHSGVTFYQDGKKLTTTTNANYSKKFGPVFPGLYTFKSGGTISGKKLVNTSNSTLVSGSQNLSLNLRIATFTISGSKGSTVYLNNKKVGVLNNSGKLKFKDYPISNNLSAYLTLQVSGKTVKSKTVNVSNKLAYGYQNISPSFEGVVSKSDAEELLGNAFSGTEYGTEDSATAELFVGQESNSSYNDLLKFFDSFKTNDNIETYNSEISKINSVTPSGKNKAIVSYSVKYTFTTSGDSGDSTKVQQFTYPNAEIVKQNGEYKIQTIGVTQSADWEKDYSD